MLIPKKCPICKDGLVIQKIFLYSEYYCHKFGHHRINYNVSQRIGKDIVYYIDLDYKDYRIFWYPKLPKKNKLDEDPGNWVEIKSPNNTSIEINYFTPNFKDLDKLLAKIKTYLLFQ